MKAFKNGKIPVKYWLKDICDIESECLAQANNLSNLPFAYHHVALMPDCHSGYGMPIGGVLATDGVVVPNAVGVDIGCGMIATQTSVQEISEKEIKEILGLAREVIPVGFKHHAKKQYIDTIELFKNTSGAVYVTKQELENIYYQVGTLGGGNHFIEIQKGDDGYIWLTIHSGSRNLGKKICDYYNEKAKELNQKYFSQVPIEWDLSFLPMGTDLFSDYLDEMTIALNFARINRQLMMDNLEQAFWKVTKSNLFGKTINIHHNYAAIENHFGKNVWVHRKGAIRMREGEIGIIPGSMGTPSYIVEGLGNKESFCSASHGAGRIMSRKAANTTITEEDANKSIEGVVFGRWSKNREGGLDVSECPLAYKNIDEVMENQVDLVKPIVKLTPLGVMKG